MEMKKGITVILLTWKRPENIKKIIDAFTRQSIKPKIFLWNNNPDVQFKDDRVDWIVNSTKDLYSYARWLMIPMVETEYVMTMDDDLMPKSLNFLAQAMDLVNQHKNIVGPFGKRIIKGSKPYNGEEIRTDYADIIKGRCMCMKTNILKRVPLGTLGRVRNDDLYVSYYAAGGKKNAHFVSMNLRKATEDLPEGNCGMDQDPNHMASRNDFINELIKRDGELK